MSRYIKGFAVCTQSGHYGSHLSVRLSQRMWIGRYTLIDHLWVWLQYVHKARQGTQHGPSYRARAMQWMCCQQHEWALRAALHQAASLFIEFALAGVFHPEPSSKLAVPALLHWMSVAAMRLACQNA